MGGKTRNTRQKEAIEETLKSFKGFFTADELYSKVKLKERDISIATVYRILKQFYIEGRIHIYSCGRGNIYSVEGSNHCHLICHKCGKTTHFDVKDMSFIKNSVKGKLCHFQLDVYGLCEKCTKIS